MGKQKKNSFAPASWESKDFGHWVRIYDDCLRSEAFISLSSKSKVLYINLKSEYKGNFNEVSNIVKLTYDQIIRFTGIRKNDIRKHLDELEAFGFIEISGNGGLHRTMNQYKLIGRWQKLSKEECKAIKKTFKEKQAEYKRRKAVAKKSACDFTDSC